jgi:hypothetical protein
MSIYGRGRGPRFSLSRYSDLMTAASVFSLCHRRPLLLLLTDIFSYPLMKNSLIKPPTMQSGVCWLDG